MWLSESLLAGMARGYFYKMKLEMPDLDLLATGVLYNITQQYL